MKRSARTPRPHWSPSLPPQFLTGQTTCADSVTDWNMGAGTISADARIYYGVHYRNPSALGRCIGEVGAVKFRLGAR